MLAIIFSFLILGLRGAVLPQIGSSELVQLKLTNQGELWVKLQRYSSGLETHCQGCFAVHFEGTELPYDGLLVLRGDPEDTCNHFIYIAPGETLTTTIPISEYFDISSPGSYSIKFGDQSPRKIIRSELTFVDYPKYSQNAKGYFNQSRTNQSCEEIPVVGIEDSNLIIFRSNPLQNYKKTIGQQVRLKLAQLNRTEPDKTVKQALKAFDYYIKEAISDLKTAPNRCTKRWFDRTASSVATDFVKNYFSNATKYLANATIIGAVEQTVCQTGALAYVDPKNRTFIQICSNFYKINLMGRSGQATSLIHELLHSSALIVGNNESYFKDTCLELAERGNGYRNPKNYEFYVDCFYTHNYTIRTIHNYSLGSDRNGKIIANADVKDNIIFICEGDYPDCKLRVRNIPNLYLDFDSLTNNFKLGTDKPEFELLYLSNGASMIQYSNFWLFGKQTAIFKDGIITAKDSWGDDFTGLTFFEIIVSGFSSVPSPFFLENMDNQTVGVEHLEEDAQLRIANTYDHRLIFQQLGHNSSSVLRTIYRNQVLVMNYGGFLYWRPVKMQSEPTTWIIKPIGELGSEKIIWQIRIRKEPSDGGMQTGYFGLIYADATDHKEPQKSEKWYHVEFDQEPF